MELTGLSLICFALYFILSSAEGPHCKINHLFILFTMLDKTPQQEMHHQMSEVLQRLKESQHRKESASADEGRPCLWAWPLIKVSLCTESTTWMRGANEHFCALSTSLIL